MVDKISIEKHKKLKNEVETERRKSSFIKASGSLSKTGCERLDEELYAGLFSLDRQCHPRPYSEPASMSASKKSSSAGHLNGGPPLMIKQKEKKKELLRKKIVASLLHCDFARLIVTFFDNVFSNAHKFLAEVCDST